MLWLMSPANIVLAQDAQTDHRQHSGHLLVSTEHVLVRPVRCIAIAIRSDAAEVAFVTKKRIVSAQGMGRFAVHSDS